MKILVAVDGTIESKRALLKTFELAKPSDEIIILSVVELLRKTISTTIQVDCDYQLIEKANHHRFEMFSVVVLPHLLRVHETDALLAEYQELCQSKSLNCRVISERGEPKDIICEMAEREHVDMLVLGTRDRSGLTKFFLGSVSEHCLEHVKCSVLIVR